MIRLLVVIIHIHSHGIEGNLAKPINYNPKNRPNRQKIKNSF